MQAPGGEGVLKMARRTWRAYACLRVLACACTNMCVRVCACVYVCVFVCACAWLCMYVCMCVLVERPLHLFDR